MMFQHITIRLLLSAGLVCLAVLLPVPAISQIPAPEDPAALERVWQQTIVVFPQEPEVTWQRAAQVESIAARLSSSGKLPAVVFLHGCNGISPTGTQVRLLLPAFASAGFVVFAPDSLARPRESYCDPKTLKSSITRNDVLGRIAEARSTLKHIRTFPWIDEENIFLAGHSMGGMSTANYPDDDFRAYVIIGYHCYRALDGRNNGVKIPAHKPVLAIRGAADEWFAGSVNEHAHCGESMPRHTDATSLVIPGLRHDLFEDAAGRKVIVDYLVSKASRPILPVEPPPPSPRFDGLWSGQVQCEGDGRSIQPFSAQASLPIKNGTGEWKTLLSSGLRGFRVRVGETGYFMARGDIGPNGYIEVGANTQPVRWSIILPGKATDEAISASGFWGTLPCRLSLTRA